MPALPRKRLESGVYDWSSVSIPTRVGERRDFFDAATVTFRNLECHATTLNPGETPHEPHRHPDEELIVVKEGALDVMINGRTKVATTGAVIFIRSNDFHGLKNRSDGRSSYHVIRIATSDTPAK